jgi:uncharacterized protein
MPRGASPKRERQFEHIKESAKKTGRYGRRAEEVAARTVNKIRRERGETKSQGSSSTRSASHSRATKSRARSRSKTRKSPAPRSRTRSSSSRIRVRASQPASRSRRTSSRRGFAGMSEARQRAIAAQGGRAAHQRGAAHEFSTVEARKAGQKGGEAVSKNRSHMAEIGRRGGER